MKGDIHSYVFSASSQHYAEALTMIWGSNHVAAILHEVWQRIHRRICTIGKKSCINPEQSNHKLTHTHSVLHTTSYHWQSRLLLALKKRQTAGCEKSEGYTPFCKSESSNAKLGRIDKHYAWSPYNDMRILSCCSNITWSLTKDT